MVQAQISIGHEIYREPCRYRRTARGAIDFADTIDRTYRRIEAVDQEAGYAILDQLGHRSAVAGNHWRSAGERFHHRQAKRLIEIDEVEQRARGAESPCAPR